MSQQGNFTSFLENNWQILLIAFGSILVISIIVFRPIG